MSRPLVCLMCSDLFFFLEEPLALSMTLPVKSKGKVKVAHKFCEKLCRTVNTWTTPHRGAMLSASKAASSQLSFLWNVLLSFLFLSIAFLYPLPPSLIPPSLRYTPCPFTLSALLHISPLSPAQTGAKGLIPALRPSKLSQLSSFSPLSVSISSNTLQACRYGHQRVEWYFWPLCVKN